MRLRLMATYQGAPYQAGLGPDGTQAMLLSPVPPPAGLGFTAAAGHWRKQVSLTELEELWLSRPEGEYRGEPCLVLDDLGDRLHIAYLGRDAARAAQLGYWEIDREVFEVVVARHEVLSLAEGRVDLPLAAATFAPPDQAAGTATAQTAGPAGAEPDLEVSPAAGPGPGPEASSETDPEAGPGDDGAARPEADAEAGPAADRGADGDVPASAGGPAGPDLPAAEVQRAGYGRADRGSRGPDRMTAWHGSPEPWADDEPAPDPRTGGGPAAETQAVPATGRRTGRKDRVSPESVFAELLSLAAIPHRAYAVDEEVPGAMCLVQSPGGFEVFSRTDDARLEVRFFADEEAAYFYLFGVLVAEAVRSGRLRPNTPQQVNGQPNGAVPAGRPGGAARDIA